MADVGKLGAVGTGQESMEARQISEALSTKSRRTAQKSKDLATQVQSGKNKPKEGGGGAFLANLPPENGCFIPPTHQFLRYWDVWVVSLLLYTALITPYEVAFLETKLNALFVFNRLVDLSFLADIVLNFFMPYFDVDRQQWITTLWRIALRYLTRWFLLDFMSVLPFDTVLLLQGQDKSSLRMFRTVRLLRLMKLLRVFRASRILNRWKSALGLSNSTLSLTKFAMVATFVAHWSACLWALAPSIEDRGESWIIDQGMSTASAGELYATCLYWSVMTLTTIGYGDIVPQTVGERMVGILCMLTGGSIYAYIIGAVCGIVSNIDKATSSYLQALDNLNQYMSEIKLPNNLRLALREYFDHCKQLHRNKYYQGLLMQMSPSLRKQVAMHCHSVWIRTVPFFNAANAVEREDFVASLAVVLVPMAFAPLEKVVLEGERTNKMYIIQRGVAIRRRQILGQGDYFGEDMILTNSRREYSVRSLTYLDVYSLSKRGLRDALNAGEFEQTKKLIRRAAVKLALRREMLRAVVTSKLKRGLLDNIGQATGDTAFPTRAPGLTAPSPFPGSRKPKSLGHKTGPTVTTTAEEGKAGIPGLGKVGTGPSAASPFAAATAAAAATAKSPYAEAPGAEASPFDAAIDSYVETRKTALSATPSHHRNTAHVRADKGTVLGLSGGPRRRSQNRGWAQRKQHVPPITQSPQAGASASPKKKRPSKSKDSDFDLLSGALEDEDTGATHSGTEMQKLSAMAAAGYTLDDSPEDNAHGLPTVHHQSSAGIEEDTGSPLARATPAGVAAPPGSSEATAGTAGILEAARKTGMSEAEAFGVGQHDLLSKLGAGASRAAQSRPGTNHRTTKRSRRRSHGSTGSAAHQSNWNVLNADSLSLIAQTLVPALRSLERSHLHLEQTLAKRNTTSATAESRIIKMSERVYETVTALETKHKWLNALLFIQSMIIIVVLVLSLS